MTCPTEAYSMVREVLQHKQPVAAEDLDNLIYNLIQPSNPCRSVYARRSRCLSIHSTVINMPVSIYRGPALLPLQPYLGSPYSSIHAYCQYSSSSMYKLSTAL